MALRGKYQTRKDSTRVRMRVGEIIFDADMWYRCRSGCGVGCISVGDHGRIKLVFKVNRSLEAAGAGTTTSRGRIARLVASEADFVCVPPNQRSENNTREVVGGSAAHFSLRRARIMTPTLAQSPEP